MAITSRALSPALTQALRRTLLGILLLATPLLAQAAFITDKIVVEVRSERFGQGEVLKKLPSGTSVEVLMTDGQYTRVRTPDNLTGWVNTTFITKQKPTQLEYLELMSMTKDLEAKLKAAEDKLASAPTGGGADISADELEELQKRAKDASWMRVEMTKARERAASLEKQLKSKGKAASSSEAELDTLREQNADLEKRLAAALLVNEQISEQQISEQQAELSTAPEGVAAAATPDAPAADDQGWSVKIEWFLGSIVTAIIIGIIVGMTWLDKRIRQRHGGFRIY